MQKDMALQVVKKSSLEEVITAFFNKYPEVKNTVSYMTRGVFTREVIEFFIRTRIFDLIGALNLPGPSQPSRLCLKAALLYEKNFFPSLAQNPFMRNLSDPLHVQAVENELETSLQTAGVIVSVLLNQKLPKDICYKILCQVEEDFGEIPRILWEDKIKIENAKELSSKIMGYAQRNLLMNEAGRERMHSNQFTNKKVDAAASCVTAKRPGL